MRDRVDVLHLGWVPLLLLFGAVAQRVSLSITVSLLLFGTLARRVILPSLLL